ncbi:MAG: PAS domain-containing protein [Candidatus Jettenia sp.]|uniref:PAS domain-containing protein n=1 Tax=Candidatus Jettenia caeni TaxID=247490 RepID=I3IGS3_9BACT|nr:PAS domain-containing protein [Candidatus Jettenia sp. AMX1]MBC6927881.1 PAS domain-containing protein [Candidatus Jettenia sp.]NUN24685.1 PAS domain-containing protein [Candidatus Jettenia caeni]KAA0251289.1 MAG: PAS domain-containing protein [Candidatus Jettenia sp. AMX1]MCE7880313.1 PAS domain-containing protein [Candidatus Jettenia sp. AMX1]MCQ3926154.1 PAS domain-containing protein [Candidatus Jettenia sp.]
MNNKNISSAKDESKTSPDVQDVKGWYEYEPSYDGVIIHINSAGARLFGFASPDDVIGKKINELYAHPFDHEKTLSMLFRDGQVNGFYTLMKTKSGKLFFIRQSSTLVTEGLYKCPLKVKNEFESIQASLSL